jgi:3-methyladenine DNA glycosylase AlkD
VGTASIVSAELRALANKEIAESRTWFFKTGKGEYGYGDIFLGIEVPAIREVAKRHQELTLDQIKKLASSKYHEERFIALAIMVLQFKKAKAAAAKKQLLDTYLELLKDNRVNNWDLVDASAPYLGVYLLDFPGAKALLAKLAKSKNLWEQRASIMFTWAYIRAGQLEVSTKQVELFLDHPHDLIHKSAGWMLREVGKKDLKLLRSFLDAYAAVMPRVMLRYAIEKMTEAERAKWLGKAKS